MSIPISFHICKNIIIIGSKLWDELSVHVQDSPDSNLGEIWKRNAHKIHLIGLRSKKKLIV